MLVGVPLILTASISLLRKLFLFFVFSVFLSFLFLLLLLRPDTWKLVKGNGEKIIKMERVERPGSYGRHVTNLQSILIDRIFSHFFLFISFSLPFQFCVLFLRSKNLADRLREMWRFDPRVDSSLLPRSGLKRREKRKRARNWERERERERGIVESYSER